MTIHKVGMRNVKTAIAVFLCIIILQLIKAGHPFYAVIAAVITMQDTVGHSFKTGLSRMAGTLIGAGFGILLSLISPRNIFLTTAGVVIVIYFTNLLNLKQSTTIACVVFLGIMTNLTGTTPVLYSSLRVLETFLGIIVAVAVNFLIFPPRAEDES